MKNRKKYHSSEIEGEGDILPNLINLTTKPQIGLEEARGFIEASFRLTTDTYPGG